MKKTEPQSETEQLVQTFMETIVEYRTIVAELTNFNQGQISMLIYRAEHRLSDETINMITDLNRFRSR